MFGELIDDLSINITHKKSEPTPNTIKSEIRYRIVFNHLKSSFKTTYWLIIWYNDIKLFANSRYFDDYVDTELLL